MLVQGGALLSEYSQLFAPAVALQVSSDAIGEDGLAVMFPVGIAGIVLAILAPLGIASFALTSISAIAFGVALMLSVQSVRRLYGMQAATRLTAMSGIQCPGIPLDYLRTRLLSITLILGARVPAADLLLFSTALGALEALSRAQVFLFGAELTRGYAYRFGSRRVMAAESQGPPLASFETTSAPDRFLP